MHRYRLRMGDRELVVPPQAEISVGRDHECDIVLEDRLASRRHARFHMKAGALFVEDLGSTNGIEINDQPCTGEREVAHRDRVKVGAHVIVVLGGLGRTSSAPTEDLRSPATRPVARARSTNVTLERARALTEKGEGGAALEEIVPIATALADATRPANDQVVNAVLELLPQLMRQSGDSRAFELVFRVLDARERVISGEMLDEIGSAIREVPSIDRKPLDRYLASIQRRGAELTTSERVQLRRLETLARSLGAASR